jgi:predicted XRE-type DNA-binding protein
MKTGGNFKKDLEEDLKNPKFKVYFHKEKARLKLSDKLERALRKSNLSIRKVAQLMGSSKSQVERIIKEPDANISVDTLLRFAEAVGKKLEIKLL